MLSRMLRAYGRRVGGSDIEDLREMFELQQAFSDAVHDAVTRQRADLGRSWADIAAASGTTRQAAQMRYGKPKKVEDLPLSDAAFDPLFTTPQVRG